MRLSIHAVGVRLLTRFVPAPAKRFSVSSRLAGASYALVLFDSSSSSSSSIAAGGVSVRRERIKIFEFPPLGGGDCSARISLLGARNAAYAGLAVQR